MALQQPVLGGYLPFFPRLNQTYTSSIRIPALCDIASQPQLSYHEMASSEIFEHKREECLSTNAAAGAATPRQSSHISLAYDGTLIAT